MYLIIKKTFQGEYSSPDVEYVGIINGEKNAIDYIEKLAGRKAEHRCYGEKGYEAGCPYDVFYIAEPVDMLN